MKSRILIFISIAWATFACQSSQKTEQVAILQPSTKVVSLSGTLTEILCELGFEKNIVGVDVTSTFPASILALPKAGHTRNIEAEGLLSMNPEAVFAVEGEIKPELQQQLSAAGVKLYLFPAAKSLEEGQQLIQMLADTLGVPEKATSINTTIKNQIKSISSFSPSPKVLFIYARGAGTLMVAGDNTALTNMIQIAGAQNAVTGFEDFKPLSTEVLVESNPDIILLFESGLSSLSGVAGLLALPGMMSTKAGKNKALISMDGQFLSGFGPRTGSAALELHQKIKALIQK